MKISQNTNFTNIVRQNKVQTQKESVRHTVSNSVYPKAPLSALRAYSSANISFSPSFKGIEKVKKYVSEEAAAKILDEAGIKRQGLIPEIIGVLKDAEGKIQETVLELFKMQNKSGGPLAAKNVFSGCKENGTLNEEAANIFVNLFKGSGISYGVDYQKTINSCKNPDGTFCPEILKLLQNEKAGFSRILSSFDRYIAQYRKKDNSFNAELIKAVDDAVKAGESPSAALSDRLAVLNPDGTINNENLKIYREFKDMNLYYNLKTAYETVTKREGEEKKAAIEFIRAHKNERNLGQIIRVLEEDGQQFNDESLNYAKELMSMVSENEEALTRYKKLLKINRETLNEETKHLVQRFRWEKFTPEFEKAMVDYASKDGKINYKKVSKLLDIYWQSRTKEAEENALRYVQNLMDCLPKGEYEDTFDAIHQLYTYKFPDNKSVSPHFMDFWTGLLTYSKNPDAIKKGTERIKFALSTKLGQADPRVVENMIYLCDANKVRRLEEINFQELNIPPEQIISLQDLEEVTLLKLKEFIKKYQAENNIKSCEVEFNSNNINQMIISHNNAEKATIFELGTFEKVTETQTRKGGNRIVKTEKDLRTNTTTEVIEDKKDYFRTTVASQKRIVRNKNNETAYTEVLTKSEIPGVFNVEHRYPDGSSKILSKAYIDKNTGNEIIHKELESLNKTKTCYHYESDKAGNRLIDYAITDREGKEIARVNSTFEVLSDNHFISSKNGKTYDIMFENNAVIVKNLTDSEELTYNLVEFTDGGQDNLMPILKQISGDEWFKMKKIGVNKMLYRENYDNAGWLQKNTLKNKGSNPLPDKSMIFGKNHVDYSVFEHELGHAIDENLYSEIGEEIAKDPKLLKIWNKERELFRAEFSDAQQEFISYFIADAHYLGKNGGLKEGIAETNSLINNSHTHNDIQSVRLQYWQQYFPETIAYLSKIL